MTPNCAAGTALQSPTNLVENICFKAGGATKQGTKTVATVNGVTTVVYKDSAGAVVTGVVEVTCPMEVMVVGQDDVHVASFVVSGGNIVLTQTDGTSWSAPVGMTPAAIVDAVEAGIASDPDAQAAIAAAVKDDVASAIAADPASSAALMPGVVAALLANPTQLALLAAALSAITPDAFDA